VFNCTEGASSLAALRAAGAANLESKIVVDMANVLTPDGPGPESLGEQIQKAFPNAKVVKAVQPPLAGLGRGNDRMAGRAGVLRAMTVRELIPVSTSSQLARAFRTPCFSRTRRPDTALGPISRILQWAGGGIPRVELVVRTVLKAAVSLSENSDRVKTTTAK
jgi:hypothetical protein